MCGSTQDSSSGTRKAWLLKLDLDGQVLWEKFFGQDSALFRSLTLLDKGRFALSGSLFDAPSAQWKPWMLICSSWGDTLFSQTIETELNANGFGLAAGLDTTELVFLSNMPQNTSASTNLIALAAVAFPCPLWYPKALQINNFWCPGNEPGCYPFDSLTMTELPELLLNETAREQLINYVHANRFTNILLGNLEETLLEDDTATGLPLQNLASAVSGDSLRDVLDTLLQELRQLPYVSDITCVLRDIEDENQAAITRNLAQLRAVTVFNRSRTGWFNELCVDYEFWRDQYGDPTNALSALYPFLIPGWRNYQQLSDSAALYKSDTLNRITRISTQL